jgi:hypothetical protein
MKITATFEVYHTTSDTIEISKEINPADFDDEDEIYNYIYGQAVKEARKAGYYNYDEPEIDCVFYDDDDWEE